MGDGGKGGVSLAEEGECRGLREGWGKTVRKMGK